VVLPRNSVGLIDTSSNTVGKAVRVGPLPRDVAIGGGFIWVAKEFQRTVTRIDPHTGETASVGLALAPTGIAATSSAVWVVGRVGPILRVARVGVTRIDPSSMSPAVSIRLQEPLTLARPAHGTGGPVAPSVTATADAVWVTGGRTLWRIDAATAKVAAEIRLSDYVAAVAADEGAVWASGTSTPLVEIDTRTNATVATHRRLASEPFGIAAGAGGVWVTDRTEKTVRRYDPVTADETAVIKLGFAPGAVSVRDASVWVAGIDESSVARIDPSTNRIVATIRTGRAGIAGMSAGEDGLWVVTAGG
jgi:streptogramin lyase